MLHARPEAFGDEMAGERLAVLRAVERQPQIAVLALHHLAAHKAGGIHYIHHRQFAGAEDGRVEEQPGEHLLVVHGLRDMVDASSPAPAAGRAGSAWNSTSQTLASPDRKSTRLNSSH